MINIENVIARAKSYLAEGLETSDELRTLRYHELRRQEDTVLYILERRHQELAMWSRENMNSVERDLWLETQKELEECKQRTNVLADILRQYGYVQQQLGKK